MSSSDRCCRIRRKASAIIPSRLDTAVIAWRVPLLSPPGPVRGVHLTPSISVMAGTSLRRTPPTVRESANLSPGHRGLSLRECGDRISLSGMADPTSVFGAFSR